jgi:hypothetical protein
MPTSTYSIDKKIIQKSPPWKRDYFKTKLTTEHSSKFIAPNAQTRQLKQKNRRRTFSM